MKALKAVILLVVVLGVIAAAAASMWLGKGVKLALETYGPGIVGAPVTVGSVTLAPWSGRGATKNLVIGNPDGFTGEHALKLGSVAVRVKLSSLATDTIVVESVEVRGPEIQYELGSGGSNLAKLQKNAESAVGASGAPAAKSSAPSKSLLIKDLVVSDGKIGVSASALGDKGVTIPLPSVHLTNLGGKGRTPAQAISEVLRAISSGAGKAVSSLGTKALENAASNLLGNLGGLLKGKK